VRVVEVEWARTNDPADGKVIKRGAASLPPNVWNDLATHRNVVAAAIRSALSQAGISARRVVASMPRRLVTLRFAKLPYAPPEQMRGMVAFEAQQYILFSLDEVVLDYHVVSEQGLMGAGGEEMVTVLLAAARRSLINEIVAIFEKAGLELDRLSVSALALAEHARGAIEPTALIDLEPGELDVAVVSDARLLFTRAASVPFDPNNMEAGVRRLIEEVIRSLTSYQNEFRSRGIVHISLAGADFMGGQLDVLERALTDVLEMPVSRLVPRLLPPGDPSGLEYATAVGAALQTRGGSPAPINLAPDDKAIARAERGEQHKKVLSVLAATAIVLAALFYITTTMSGQTKERTARAIANTDLKNVTSRYDVLNRKQKKAQELSNEINTGLARKYPTVDVLAAVAYALPRTDGIWLTQFAFNRESGLTIRGETKSEIAATDLVLALQQSGAFREVRLGYLGDSQSSETAVGNAPAANAPTTNAPVTNAPTTSAAPITVPPATFGQPALPGMQGAAPPPANTNPTVTTSPAASSNPTASTGTGTTIRRRTLVTAFIITAKINDKANDLLPSAIADTLRANANKPIISTARAIKSTPTKRNDDPAREEDFFE